MQSHIWEIHINYRIKAKYETKKKKCNHSHRNTRRINPSTTSDTMAPLYISYRLLLGISVEMVWDLV